jgi:hypothetical protein
MSTTAESLKVIRGLCWRTGCYGRLKLFTFPVADFFLHLPGSLGIKIVELQAITVFIGKR